MTNSTRRSVVLVRAVNLGATHRLPMAEFRAGLAELGCTDVATYLQSGNAVVTTPDGWDDVQLTSQVQALLSDRWGLSVPVLVRSGEDILRVHRRDPLRPVATDDKLYSVVFFAAPVNEVLAAAAARDGKSADAWGEERWLADGRELYLWQPGSIHASPLGTWVSKVTRDAPGTARNWRTLSALAALVEGT